MSKINVKNSIIVYEKNDGEWGKGYPDLIVENHWNVNGMVVLVFDRTKIVVNGADLKLAIENATND